MRLFPRVLLLALLAVIPLDAAKPDTSKRFLLGQFIELTDAAGTVETFRIANVARTRAQLENVLGDKLKDPVLKRAFERAMTDYDTSSRQLFAWYRWREAFVNHYNAMFTEADLRALVPFLKTDAGRAYLKASASLGPELTKQLEADTRDSAQRLQEVLAATDRAVREEREATARKLLEVPTNDLEDRARQGDVAAQFIMGLNFSEGRNGATKDPIEAIKWYRMAANQGHAGARGQLGIMCWQGVGMAKDVDQAKQLFEAAAAAGDVQGTYCLGLMHLAGDGFPKDPAAALTFFGKVARLGFAPAQYQLAVLHWNGTGVPRNLSESYAWLTLAREAGLPEAEEFDKFTKGRWPFDALADGGMRLSSLRREIAQAVAAEPR